MLIVNDVPAEMSYVIDVLTKLGIDVQIETSTNDALRALSQNSYHVVIWYAEGTGSGRGRKTP